MSVFVWLEAHNVRACLIGALAVQRWGAPRLTEDVDLTVVAEIGEEERIVDICLEKFRARRSDARAFALQYRVIVLYAGNDVPVDIALGATSFEVECVDRATPYEFEPGFVLPTCSAEDLLIHKTFAGRPRDIDDLPRIVNRQLGKLDLARIRRWLKVLAEIKGDPDLARPFEEALKAAETIAAKRKAPR